MVSNLLPLITTAIPRRVIQQILGAEQLGYFSTIFTPTVLVTTLIPTVVVAILPHIGRAWAERDRRAMKRWVVVSYTSVAVITLAAELAALLIGKSVMQLIFGKEILQYYDLLYWAILATGLNAATSCGNGILTAMRKNISVAGTASAALLLTAAMSSILISKNGIYGASFVLILAYGMQNILQIFLILLSLYRELKE